MNRVKPFVGVALMSVGALLLVVCRLAGWQTNAELLVGLSLVILGFMVHVRGQKGGEKY